MVDFFGESDFWCVWCEAMRYPVGYCLLWRTPGLTLRRAKGCCFSLLFLSEVEQGDGDGSECNFCLLFLVLDIPADIDWTREQVGKREQLEARHTRARRCRTEAEALSLRGTQLLWAFWLFGTMGD
jgi:hypothetical protein